MAQLTERPALRVAAARALPTARDSAGTMDDYVSFAARHLTMIAVLVTAGALAGLALTWLKPPEFTASAALALEPVPTYVSRLAATGEPPYVTIDTDAQLFQSSAVVDAVAAATGSGRAAARNQLTVTATPLSRVLHVQVTAGSAVAAADGANAAAQAFVGVRKDALTALRRDQLRSLSLRISELETRVAQQQVRPTLGFGESPLVTQLADFQALLGELQRARISPAEIIQQAVPPSRPDRGNTDVLVTSGAMTGLLLACAVAAVRDRRAGAARKARPKNAPTPPLPPSPALESSRRQQSGRSPREEPDAT